MSPFPCVCAHSVSRRWRKAEGNVYAAQIWHANINICLRHWPKPVAGKKCRGLTSPLFYIDTSFVRTRPFLPPLLVYISSTVCQEQREIFVSVLYFSRGENRISANASPPLSALRICFHRYVPPSSWLFRASRQTLSLEGWSRPTYLAPEDWWFLLSDECPFSLSTAEFRQVVLCCLNEDTGFRGTFLVLVDEDDLGVVLWNFSCERKDVRELFRVSRLRSGLLLLPRGIVRHTRKRLRIVPTARHDTPETRVLQQLVPLKGCSC